MLRPVVLALMVLLLLAPGLAAAPLTVALQPPAASVAFRAYGLGLFPLDGKFTRFDGILTYDPENRGQCRVRLQVEVASLVMSDPSLRDDLVGPEFMDAARFPSLRFEGQCEKDAVSGQLSLHGVTRPFALDLDWQPAAVTAQGRLRRAAWGMTARPLVGGKTVRITVQVPLASAERR
ncbi:MAG: YceI family protein [Rhodospirillales bacterium]|nr:YceI family protein [Rhodospirillales bacterium]